MAGSLVRLRAAPSYYFKFPPSPEPSTLSPAQADYSLARPFNIDHGLYNNLLDVKVPLTIAAVYATTVFFMNRLNKRRGNKAWPISQTSTFFAFMIAHNVLLAVYSAWTFVGMMNALKNITPKWEDSNSLVDVVDAFCKMSGPRGLGDAVWWNRGGSNWTTGNPAIKLLGGNPDPTDVGRLWNEGLAFYGWLFYLSKFYEVIDTMIILAKGKRSSFLQTYHHAGAMLCMWAGIRYMSAPIWMFVTVNSLIHALMYSYYTVSAFGVKVPSLFKRTLTTLQITQFVIGMLYAVVHLFIAYRVPVHSPYVFIHNLSTALPSATSTVAAAASTADVGSWVKKAVLRAVGDEGLSENVRNNNGNSFGLDGMKAAQIELADVQKAREEIRYRLEYTEANCIDTSGQAFAIMLNALYLLPLTMLFVRFFVKSYLRRTSGPARPDRSKAVGKSSYDAAKRVEHEVLKAMARDRGSAYNSTSNSDSEALSPVDPEFAEKTKALKSRLSEQIESVTQTTTSTASQAKTAAQDQVQRVKETITQSVSKLENFDDLSAETREVISRVTQNTKDKAADLANLTEDKAKRVVQEIKEATSSAITKGSEAFQWSDKVHSSEELTHGEEEEESKEESTETKEETTSSASALEVSIDEATSSEEKKAEEKMQPDVVNESKS